MALTTPTRGKRIRNYAITHFAYEEWLNWYADDTNYASWCRAMIWQPEIGSQGRKHIQCFIQLKQPKTIVALRALIPDSSNSWMKEVHTAAHIKNLIAYCSKPSKTRFVLGDSDDFRVWPSITAFLVKGQRSDLALLISKIQGGASNLDMLMDPETDGIYARYHRHASHIREVLLESIGKKERNVSVYVLFGEAGSGKSRYAHDNYGDIYVPPLSHKGGALWWDGYDGQEAILLEDFDGEDDMSIRTFNRLTDRYPLRIQRKGGTTWACWTTVVITSNKAPDKWWYFYAPSVARRLTSVKRWLGRYPNAHVRDWDCPIKNKGKSFEL